MPIVEEIVNDPGINIEELNEEWRKNAADGLDGIKDRSKENCPTCELPKGRSKAFPCKTCNIYIHVDCVADDPHKLEAYKTGELAYECEKCFWNDETKKQ